MMAYNILMVGTSMKQLFTHSIYELTKWCGFLLLLFAVDLCQAMVQKKTTGALPKKLVVAPLKKGQARKLQGAYSPVVVYYVYVQNPAKQVNPAVSGYMKRKAEAVWPAGKKRAKNFSYIPQGLANYLLKKVPTAEQLKKLYPKDILIGWGRIRPIGEDPANRYNQPFMTQPIYFYDLNDPLGYGVFTNFYRAPIKVDGALWPTTEHYFQAQKFPTQPSIQEQIRKNPEPRKVFDIANSFINKWYVRSDWNQESVFLPAMYRGLVAKFTQHPLLYNKLLATKNKILVEDTAKAKREDTRWGAGKDYKGENYLGRLLMYIRDQSRLFKMK